MRMWKEGWMLTIGQHILGLRFFSQSISGYPHPAQAGSLPRLHGTIAFSVRPCWNGDTRQEEKNNTQKGRENTQAV